MHEKFVSDRDSSVTEGFAASLVHRADRAQEQRYTSRLTTQLPSQTQAQAQAQAQARSFSLGGEASLRGESSYRGDPSLPNSSDLTPTELKRRKRLLQRELVGMTLTTTIQVGCLISF